MAGVLPTHSASSPTGNCNASRDGEFALAVLPNQDSRTTSVEVRVVVPFKPAESNIKERAMCQTKLRKPMNRRTFLNATTTAAGAIAVSSQLSEQAVAQPVDESPTFRRPKTIIPLPTPSLEFQHVADGVPDTKMTREATGLLREFGTPVLINHSHRVFFWANEMGRQTGQKFDVELVFICAAFHDFGLLKKFSSATDRFEVDSANAVRQFLEHHGVPNARIQTAWDAISLHTTPVLQHTSLWKWSFYTMASHWIHWALGTKPFPKTFAHGGQPVSAS
jgi:hypothetical protein